MLSIKYVNTNNDVLYFKHSCVHSYLMSDYMNHSENITGSWELAEYGPSSDDWQHFGTPLHIFSKTLEYVSMALSKLCGSAPINT